VVAHRHEKVDEITVQIIVDFNFTQSLREQERRGAAERLAIRAMRWDEPKEARGETTFSAHIGEK
jgi:hypothetical protein